MLISVKDTQATPIASPALAGMRPIISSKYLPALQAVLMNAYNITVLTSAFCVTSEITSQTQATAVMFILSTLIVLKPRIWTALCA